MRGSNGGGLASVLKTEKGFELEVALDLQFGNALKEALRNRKEVEIRVHLKSITGSLEEDRRSKTNTFVDIDAGTAVILLKGGKRASPKIAPEMVNREPQGEPPGR